MAQRPSQSPPALLTRIGLSGFKSHFDWNELELRALTILCGANSSGKSSVMQPLLMLKQTLDALPLDVGPLKLDGPNVHFSHAEQFLSSRPGVEQASRLELLLEAEGSRSARLSFRGKPPAVELEQVVYTVGEDTLSLVQGQVTRPELFQNAAQFFPFPLRQDWELRASRFASFLIVEESLSGFRFLHEPVRVLVAKLRNLIHIPGLRGNPSRTYARTAPGAGQPGLFHDRVAGILADWQEKKDPRLWHLDAALATVELTSTVESRLVDASNLELRVGRTVEAPPGGDRDTVNIADVGFGVSQVLPVLVALVAAEPGQLVYCEQPELHLHPRAQRGVADLLAGAARRGVQVIVETHSDIILSRLQWNIARSTDRLEPEHVIAHWFERDSRTGVTRIRSNTPDDTGAFGDWPVDFADVAAEVDREYADAAYERLPPEST